MTFCVKNDFSFNFFSSYCMVFKPKSYKFSSPWLYKLWTTKYTDDITYFGFTWNCDQKDGKDLVWQLRMLSIKQTDYYDYSIIVLLMWRLHFFAVTYFYCPILQTHYKKSTHSKLRDVFNTAYRHILKLPPRSSASTMYAVTNIDSFEVLIRKRIFSFTEPLNNCKNTIKNTLIIPGCWDLIFGAHGMIYYLYSNNWLPYLI